MNSHHPKGKISGPHFWTHFALHALAGLFVFLLSGIPLWAATSPAPVQTLPTKSLPLTVKTSDKGVDVVVPAGCTSVLVEVRLNNSPRWVRWSAATLSGKPVLLNVAKSYSAKIVEWRATGQINQDKALAFAAKSKFPDRFYQGTRSFTKTPALGYKPAGASTATDAYRMDVAVSSVATSPISSTQVKSSNVTAADSTTAPQSSQVVEADIWKTDGTTVYFFNQLRGLQVLDISDPSNPLLVASLRMPAIGQDLYLLPATVEGQRDLVLLTGDPDGSYNTTNVVVVRVSGRSAQEVSRCSLKGWLADSRMAGGRLFVATTDWNLSGNASYNTLLSEIFVDENGSQTLGAVHNIDANAYSAVISAGTDWLSVASTGYVDGGYHSQITLFGLDDSGAKRLTEKPLQTRGCIYDKYKVSYQNGTLTAVSTSWGNGAVFGPVSVLENFTVSGTKLASLEIMPGETLRATRFITGKVYVVTAEFTDPLWIVDISDPKAPRITGSVEVPGFSTYIEPMGETGEFLFTIGLEGSNVAASLFNVADVANPTLVDRVYVNENQWGYSEAVYDDKALKVLHEEGLALIPFSASYWSPAASKSEKTSFVRLIDISLASGGKLKLRGRLDHDFSPRRATLVDGILVSISQKELITANVDDRDHPKVLADVALAWPVNQVIQSGEYLLQISDGSSALWSGERAAIRVSKTASESSILNDLELGDGIVQEAVLKSSKLYVLRKNWNPNNGPGLMACFVRKSSNIPTSAELALDIYDASALPALKLLGTTSVQMGSAETNCEISGILWATDTLPLVLTQTRPPGFYYPCALPLAYDISARVASSSIQGMGVAYPANRNFRAQPAYVRAFDVSNPAAPSALRAYPLATTLTTLVSGCAAGDGLLVFGYGQNPVSWNASKWRSSLAVPQSYDHRLGVLDFANPKVPLLRSPVSLPGRLVALGDVSRTGFLAYTESLQTTADGPVRQLQANLVDETQASLIGSTIIGTEASLAIDGRTVFVADSQTMTRLLLDDSANFIPAGDAANLGVSPLEIRARGQSVLGTTGSQVFRVSWPGLSPLVEAWKVRLWFPLARAAQGLDRNIYAPVGEFGVNVLNSLNADTGTSAMPSISLPSLGNTITIATGAIVKSGGTAISDAGLGSISLSGTIGANALVTGSLSATAVANGALTMSGSVASVELNSTVFAGSLTLVSSANTGTGGNLVLTGSGTLLYGSTLNTSGIVSIKVGEIVVGTITSGSLQLNGSSSSAGVSILAPGTLLFQIP